MIEHNNKKPVLLHFHIFKNAGNTIQWIFEKNFSSDVVRIDIENGKFMSQKFVLNYLKNHPKLKFFSSHQIRFPLPESNIFQFIPILFLRHPLDRIYSIYNFNRTRPLDWIYSIYNFNRIRPLKNRISIEKAKSLNFNEFVEWLLRKTNDISNLQTRFVSNRMDEELNDNDFQIAKNRLKNCTILGIVDRFDESLVSSLPLLSKWYKNLKMTYESQNFTKNRNENFEERLEEIKSKLKDGVINEFYENNDFDFQLYSLANKEINNRIESIKDFEIKLLEFQKSISKKNFFLSRHSHHRSKHVRYSSESNSYYFINKMQQKIFIE